MNENTNPQPQRVTGAEDNPSLLNRALNFIEVVGNKLPDPAMLFLLLMIVVWILSWLLSGVAFTAEHPATGENIRITNLLTGQQIASFLSTMVTTFTSFAPLGVVLVAMLGVGVAEHSGYINAALRSLLGVQGMSVRQIVKRAVVLVLGVAALAGVLELYRRVTWAEDGYTLAQHLLALAPWLSMWTILGLMAILLIILICWLLGLTLKQLMTPLLILVAIISHTAVDAGYVVVIPLGGIIFYAIGRHPLAGIAAAFAGVSGGFSANFIPSAIDPLLMGFTLPAAQMFDPAVQLHPLINWYFTSISCILIVAVGWWLTDRVVEPRLKHTAIDGDKEEMPEFRPIEERDRKALRIANWVILASIILLIVVLIPPGSPMRDPNTGELATFAAPVMQSIVPLIFLIFVLPGVVFGFLAGTFKNSKDVIDAMSKTMSSMAYYIVMAFFCALFVAEFGRSGLGILMSVEGGNFLAGLNLPGPVTLVGIIFLVGVVNLFVGSASAKWALLAPIFVPMLMQVGFSPELTQAAYRVGDSASNIVTPLLPYFPLVVVYCQRYVKGTGIGTLVSLMLPYSVVFMIAWSLFLIGYWMLGIPLGPGTSYTYP